MLQWLRGVVSGADKQSLQVPALGEQKSDLLNQIEILSERVRQMELTLQASNKTLRRIHLGSDQNSAILRDMQAALREKSATADQASEDSYLFSEQELLEWLDGSADRNEWNSTLASTSSHQILLGQLGWQALAQLGQPYHPTDCEVLEAVVDSCEPGTIRQIVQQGYRGKDKQLIRRAKVIVAKAPDYAAASHDDFAPIN